MAAISIPVETAYSAVVALDIVQRPRGRQAGHNSGASDIVARYS